MAITKPDAFFYTSFTNGIPTEVTQINRDAFTIDQSNNPWYSEGEAWSLFQEGENWCIASTNDFVDEEDDIAANDWLILPSITLSSSTASDHLYFRARNITGKREGLNIYVCEDNGTSANAIVEADWTLIKSVPKEDIPSEDWTVFDVSLSSYKSKTVYIALANQTELARPGTLLLDDIAVGHKKAFAIADCEITSPVNTGCEEGVVSATITVGMFELLNSFTAKVSYEGKTMEKRFSSLNLAPGSTYSFAMDEPILYDEESGKLTTDYKLEIIDGLYLLAEEEGSFVFSLPSDDPVCLYHTDFEDGIPADMTQIDRDGYTVDGSKYAWFSQGNAWCIYTDPFDENNHVIASTDDYVEEDDGVAANDWLITPAIELPKNKKACRAIFRAMNVTKNREGFAVYVVAADNRKATEIAENEWQQVLTVDKSELPAEWSPYIVDLTEFAGQTVYVAIANQTVLQRGGLLLVDDLTIGNMQAVPDAQITLTAVPNTHDVVGTVTGTIIAGLLSAINGFSLEVKTVDQQITQSFSDVVIEPNQSYSFTIDETLNYTDKERVDYTVTMLDGEEVLASATSYFIFNPPVTLPMPIYHENFEHGFPVNMTRIDRDQQPISHMSGYKSTEAWDCMTDPDDERNTMVASTSYYTTSEASNDWLITPAITLPADTAQCHLFARVRSAYNTYRDGMVIKLSDANAAATDIPEGDWKTIRQNKTEPAEWTVEHVDMRAYAGKKVYIAFINSTNNGWMLYMDDINVGAITSVPIVDCKIESSHLMTTDEGHVSVDVRAGINSTIDHFEAKLIYDDKTYMQEVKTCNIAPNQHYSLAFEQAIPKGDLETKNYTVEISIDDVKIQSIDSHLRFATPFAGEQVVVAETMMSRGGTLVPRSYEGFKKMRASHNSTFFGLVYHKSNNSEDSFVPNSVDYQKNIEIGYDLSENKDVLMNRSAKGEVYDDIEALYQQESTNPILVKTSNLKGEVSDFEISLNADFEFAFSLADDDLAFEVIITEDYLDGTMWNSYSFKEDGTFLGYEDKPSSINVQFNDVVRSCFADGTMSFAKNIVAHEIVPKSMTFANPKKVQNPKNLKATILVIDKNSQKIIGAVRTKLDYTGDGHYQKIESVVDQSESNLYIYNLRGELLDCVSSLDDFDAIPNQMYIIRQNIGGVFVTKKIVLNK